MLSLVKVRFTITAILIILPVYDHLNQSSNDPYRFLILKLIATFPNSQRRFHWKSQINTCFQVYYKLKSINYRL